MVAHADRHVTKIGSEADLDPFRAEGEADRIGGIVRNSEGLNLDVADAEAATREKMLGLGELGRFAVFIPASSIPGMMRAFGKVDRNIQLCCETLEASHVVGVLVRDQDGGNVFRTLAQSAQALESLSTGESCIHQNPR